MISSKALFTRIVARNAGSTCRQATENEALLIHRFALQGGELFAVYANADANSPIAFMEHGIFVFDTPQRFIAYQDIKRIEIPETAENKYGFDVLEIEVTSLEIFRLLVSGSTGKGRDLFEVCRFLMRASEGVH